MYILPTTSHSSTGFFFHNSFSVNLFTNKAVLLYFDEMQNVNVNSQISVRKLMLTSQNK